MIYDTSIGLLSTIILLEKKCRNKDGMITILASELKGTASMDRLVKNLASPCLENTGLDFDQPGLYNYLKSPATLVK